MSHKTDPAFNLAFDRLIGHEGGFTDDRRDRGNWTSGIIGQGQLRGTKFGISAMSYPDLNIRALTVDEAKQIYHRDFWTKIHGTEIPDGVAFQLFDFAVNSGITTAIRYYQRALDVADDGIFGPTSLKAAKAMSESDQIMRINALRLDFMRKLSTWPTYGKGWAGRIVNNLLYGARDSD